MRKITIFILLVFLLVFGAAPVSANSGMPSLPHAFYGSVDINGSPAPDGTQVSATVDNGTVIPTQNPVTTEGGSYGIVGPHLLVQGDITPGATITFLVTNANGTAVGGTYTPFVAGGGPTEMNLSVNIEAPPYVPPAGGGGGGGTPTYYTQTSLFGTEESFRISSSGKVMETIEATSADGNLTITILKDTICLDKDGDRLGSLEAAIDESPPAPPEDARIIGLPYDFGPAGATFDPAITLTVSYDPEALPEDVAEEDLVIAYYDEALGEWVELSSTVDSENNTITALVSHFTTLAIIGAVKAPPPSPEPAAFTLTLAGISPAEVAPGDEVTIAVSVANTGGTEGSYTVALKINGVKEAEKSVTVAAGDSKQVSFTAAKDEPGTYSVMVGGLTGSFTVTAPAPPPPPAPTNWPLIGGIIIIGGVIVAVLLIFFLRRRAH